MDKLMKARRVHRSQFTKTYNQFEAVSNDPNVTLQELRLVFTLLEGKMTEVERNHSQIFDSLISADDTEETDMESQIEDHQAYQEKFLTAKLKLESVTAATIELKEKAARSNTPASETILFQGRNKPFKRPTLEIPKFEGSVSQWITFWSHFRKIDEDTSLDKEDKLAYLLMAMEKGSKAENIIKGYPISAENYDKALNALKNRFGRPRLVIQYYVRELLSLALKNTSNNQEKKLSLSASYDKIASHIRALESLGVATDNFATMLYPLVESSLSEEILRAWQRSSLYKSITSVEEQSENEATEDLPTNELNKLLDFLKQEVESEEQITMAVQGFVNQPESSERKLNSRRHREKSKERYITPVATASTLLASEPRKSKCIFCSGNHCNSACEKAKSMSYDVRKEIVKRSRCCFKCLKFHQIKDCKVRIKCSTCGYRHDALMCQAHLYNKFNNPSNDKSLPANRMPDSTEREKNLSNFSNFPEVILQTLQVTLYSAKREITVRAVIDSASQRSYITSRIAQQLDYPPVGKKEIDHLLFGGIVKRQAHNVYKARVKSCDGAYQCNFDVMDQPNICGDLPLIKTSGWSEELERLGITLCDSGRNKIREIDLLIGADICGKLQTGKMFELSNGLTAIEYKLGWAIMGKIKQREDSNIVDTVYSMFAANAKISDLWNLETLGIKDPIEKSNRDIRELKVQEDFMRGITINSERRYEVNLPWKDDYSPISDNYALAQKRLDVTLKKLSQQKLQTVYNDIFSEWLDTGIIERVPTTEINSFGHYLPHRPVIKHHSTTAVRPVFDASAKSVGSPSLNECLETGPNLLEQIFTSLLRFRRGKIGIIADIRKAFLQIAINKKDRDYLRFLWFTDNKLTIFRHKRVVFGLTCSPFLLGGVLKYHFEKIAQTEEQNGYSRWSKDNIENLAESFYVDNCTTSVDTVNQLKSFIKQSTEIMNLGRFELRGWEFTNDLSPKDDTLVLGTRYHKIRDTISINEAVIENIKIEPITKRTILSATHKIYDPIGFTCPVTLTPKLLLRDLWKNDTDWDTPVSQDIKENFLKWHNTLHALTKIEIPRYLGDKVLSLHCFCDASKEACGAVIYLRTVTDNVINLKFVAAKSRLAPEKTTIPRLELLAASIGSRLTSEVIKNLKQKDTPSYFWSDSTTTLAWIKRDLQWGVYVANRVKEIRNLTKGGTWNYVPGELNPADLPSRGCSAQHLLNSRWWEGPAWLRENEKNWPKVAYHTKEEEINSELKKMRVSMTNFENNPVNIAEKFSSYTKLIRFFAIMQKFKIFLLQKKANIEKQITLTEIKNIEEKYLAQLQKTMFMSENDEKLATLPTFTHKDGLIRIKTNISEREENFSFIYPIVLDRNNLTVKLLIREAHENLGHAGVQTVMCHVREKYWILKCRTAVRSVISNCIVCKKFNAKPLQVDPAPLSIHRVKDANVFEVTGVDFAGPVYLRKGMKAWICLYTCAVYRAVHLELVSSLSTQNFLLCLKRFIARRGRPSIICSDNGTNFVGTHNAFKRIKWETISKYSSAKEIDWRFNPPTAAWWGGWWERLIGLMKIILRKTLGRACLTYEELTTVLCDCENIMNSRPLTYVSEDPNDLQPLCPKMFLCEIKQSETPDIDALNKINLNKRYRLKQALIEQLRGRFRKEYLSLLINRNFNRKESRTLKIGDVVLLGNDSGKRIDWPLARIEDLIIGRNGRIYVAILRTKDGLFKRPIQRIYPLEISSIEQQAKENSYLKARDNMRNLRESLEKREEPNDDTIIHNTVSTVRTRCGRQIKKPDRLNL